MHRMAQLTDQQQKFVRAYVANGANGTAAARAAGYSESQPRAAAYKLLARPPIIEAILQQTLQQLSATVPAAMQVLVDLMRHAQSESVRLQAASKLLEHGGLVVAQHHVHHVRDERTDEEVRARIASLIAELGIALPEGTVPALIEGQVDE